MNKKAIVTGASQGIGRGIATVLAGRGYDLCITYNTAKDPAMELKAKLEEEHGVSVHVLHAALEQPDVPARVAQEAIAALGRVDLLVNNAGRTLREPTQSLSDETLDYLINLNFRAYIIMMREVSAHMIAQGIRGSIIHITSSRGQRAYPADGIYGGLKAALHRATQSAALDLCRYGIRVNCVAPGATQVRFDERTYGFYAKLSKRIPLGRAGTPTDIGNAVAFLASEEASYITGEVLRVDGGLILPGMPEGAEFQESWT